MSTHTPGPWQAIKETGATRASVRRADESEVCTVWGPSHEARKADACLIAAAPELLALLKAVEDFLADRGKETPGLSRVRAAIAKAEGQ